MPNCIHFSIGKIIGLSNHRASHGSSDACYSIPEYIFGTPSRDHECDNFLCVHICALQ